MNLDSPIFDSIRVPARRSCWVVARAVCNAVGVDPEIMQTHNGWYGAPYREIRNELLEAMMTKVRSVDLVAQWFGASPKTVRRWLDEVGYYD